MNTFPGLTRRGLLAGVSGASIALAAGPASATDPELDRATALPLHDVRLLPSRWADAVDRNRLYLLSLDPDRLLSPFLSQAGLLPKAPRYGGWESDTITGHTLGHYLSALSLLHAQTGDAEARIRVDTIVSELARVQTASGDSYVGGFTRRASDGTIENGKVIFREIASGDIRSTGFDLNGAWSPLYNVHKTLAGLLDAQALCGNQKALGIAVGMAGFLRGVFDRLDDAQVQRVLSCEYGGLNESLAEIAARTGDRSWLVFAARIYDRKVLDPLAEKQDDLANIHANTQIPKLIGLQRIAELSDDPARRIAPRFFWERVTRHHSFVIGGNADREYFFTADTPSQHITEQTCEHCNSYNMLKLTRQLFANRPDAALFDFYERAHLNHVLAAHNPRTGMFTYMTPLLSGAVREWSTPENDFWCCVGTGMESHAKHGDSIFWESGDTLLVNLFIPAEARWTRMKARLSLQTRYPDDGAVSLQLADLPAPRRFAVGFRLPGWAENRFTLAVNGVPAEPRRKNGFLVLRRVWNAGDRISLILPMSLRIERTPDDPHLITVLRGPAVLCADLGPAGDGKPYDGVDPALVAADPIADLHPAPDDPLSFITAAAGRPGMLRFTPFHGQAERRSAVYLRCFSETEWAAEQTRFLAEQRQRKELAARSVDILHLGEMQAEHDHAVSAEKSYPLVYRGRNGRDLRAGGFISFRLKIRPGPMLLRISGWSAGHDDGFTVRVEGHVLSVQPADNSGQSRTSDVDLPIPAALTNGKTQMTVRLEGSGTRTAGPFFTVRTLDAAAALPI
ncbi:glycoside hydrolase family 127 protein [Acetobacteraceae bacterium KSS8]|uniref:Glycoside hydrolase family 127 protein n=1 Tax=Endosaccharibacter trunci TaxID=2812733 RepID=A0ABT1W6R2_9PROT|nr:glycoside hydrolase family 127 protein [Acetobacteraceae bacterium KSS8]